MTAHPEAKRGGGKEGARGGGVVQQLAAKEATLALDGWTVRPSQKAFWVPFCRIRDTGKWSLAPFFDPLGDLQLLLSEVRFSSWDLLAKSACQVT